MQGLLDTIQKNIEFVGISLLLMIGVFAIARGSEIGRASCRERV